MKPRRVALAVALIVFLTGGTSDADPQTPCVPSDPCHLHMRDGGEVTTPNGIYTLPPGHFFDDPTWNMVDEELKRLQDQEHRLGAENKSLRESLGGWRPGWLTVTSFLLLGVAGGVGGYYWYDNR